MPATCSTKKQFRARLPKPLQEILPGGAARIKSDAAYRVSQSINFNLSSSSFRFSEIVKKHDLAFAEANGGMDKVTPEQRDIVNRYLDGELEALYDLPEVVQPVVSEMRAAIDALTLRLQEQGLIDEDLSAVMQENLGAYVTRAFRAYEEDGYGEMILALEKSGDERAVELMKRLRNKEKRSLVRVEANKLAEEEYKEKYGVKTITPKIRASSKWKAIYNKHKTEQNKIFTLNGKKVNERVKEFLNVYEGEPENKAANRMRRDLGVLQSRKQLPSWQRELLGEYQSPANRWLLTVAKQSRMLHTTQALMDLKDLLPSEVLMTPEDAKGPGGPGEDMVEISKEQNPAYAPIDGYFMDQDVYDMIRFHFGSRDQMSKPMKAFLKFNAAVKFSFLVLSPATQVRNFASAAFFVTSQGYVPTPSRVKMAAGIAAEINLAKRTKNPDRKISFAGFDFTVAELGEALIERGGLNESARAGDFASILNTRTEEEVSGFFFEDTGLVGEKDKWAKKLMKGPKVAEALYQMSDNIFKIVFIEQEMKSLAKQYPNKAEDKGWLMDRAVRTARANLPTYSEVGPLVRKGAIKNPIAAPFPSFAYESVRNFYNTGKMAFNEMFSSNRATKKRGAARMAGMLVSAYGMNAVVTGMVRAVAPLVSQSIDFEPLDEEEDKDALRRLVPEYYRDANLLYIGRDKSNPKKHYYTNLSFFNIHSQTVDPVKNLYRTAAGRDLGQGTIEYTAEDWLKDMSFSFLRSAEMFLSPFILQPEITSAAVGQALANSDGRSGVLYNEDIDSPSERLSKQLAHIAKGLEPPLSKGPRRVFEAIMEEDKGQVSRELSGLLGIRVSVLDENYAQLSAGSNYNKRRSQASREMKRVIFDPASSDGDIRNQVAATNREYMLASRELNADVAAMAQISRSSPEAALVDMVVTKKLGRQHAGLAMGNTTMLLRPDLISKDDYIRANSEGTMELLKRNHAIYISAIEDVVRAMPDGDIIQFPD